MPSNKFQISATHLQKKLFPSASTNTFRIGDGAGFQMSVSEAEGVLNLMEDRFFSLIRSTKYFQLLQGFVDGEVLTWDADPDENIYTLSLTPVTGPVILYASPTLERGRWKTRKQGHRYTGDFTVGLSTGEIQLEEPLAKGTRLVAEYRHTASDFPIIQHIILGWAAAEIGRRYLYLAGDQDTQRYTDWDSQATAMAMSLKNMNQGIPRLDNLDLIVGGYQQYK